jgi:asparagine synthase (glutamine-hydrolysing)
MCGIAGFVGKGNRDDILAMTTALRHRGPDGEGIFVDETAPIFLGFRRLAIVDIAGGNQPMWNEDGTVGVVFNGEIYNHVELRRELVAAGHVFRSSHSDTEVLVHGYEQWGEDLPGRLNGMFAFAVYDRPRRRLFLARDRFGEKPIYYSRRRGLFAFASELQAMTRHPDVSRAVNIRALQKFFAYGYLPAPNALYEDSRKLPSGCHLTFDIASEAIRLVRYWRFAIAPDESLDDRAEGALAEELRHLLLQAGRRRLMSDVPLGVLLSGGIDSSSVLAAAASELPSDQIETFTIGFTEPSFDESAEARAVATAFRTHHREEILDLSAARGIMPEVLSRLDEPLGDASILPTFLLCRFARTRVTVALSGDGGDELFAGYDPIKALRLAQFYNQLVPRPLHRGLRCLAALLPSSSRNMSLDFKIRRSLAGLSYPQALWNPVWLGPVEPDIMADLFNEPIAAEELYEEAISLWNRDPERSLLDRTLEFYTNLYLQDDILMKSDRASMMASLEARAVFLDNDVVAFCQRLPGRFKYRNGERKYLLKKAMAPLVPRQVLSRRKKGFGIPLAKWLRAMPITPPLAPVSGVNVPWVEKCWREHRAGRSDHRLFLWSWLSFQSLLPAAGAAR